MTWGKVSDRLHAHSKARRAREAMALWVLALSWSCDELTDGAIPADMPELLIPGGDAMAERLVSVGLWERIEAGYRFHDWAEYQPSADLERERRDAVSRVRSEAGRRGAATRWQTDGKHDGKHDAKRMANVMANGSQTDRKPIANEWQNDSPVPVPVPVHVPDPERGGVGEGERSAPALSLHDSIPSTDQPKRSRTKRAPAVPPTDTVPLDGTVARRTYEAITTDAALAPIVRGPGDLSMRLAALCDGTSVDPASEVISAGAWLLRNPGKWRDGSAGLIRWVRSSVDRARSLPAPVVGVPRIATNTRTDYQGRTVAGPAALPSGDVWTTDRDEETEAFERIRQRTQPKGATR